MMNIDLAALAAVSGGTPQGSTPPGGVTDTDTGVTWQGLHVGVRTHQTVPPAPPPPPRPSAYEACVAAVTHSPRHPNDIVNNCGLPPGSVAPRRGR